MSGLLAAWIQWGGMVLVPALVLHADGRRLRAEVGGGEAFARELVLVQPHVARLVQRLLAWPGAMAEVDDVVQDVLVSAWMARHRFRGDSQLRTWVTRIALNRVRRQRRAMRARWLLFPGTREVAGVAKEASDNERIEGVRRALGRLGHRDREVLVLRYLEGRTTGELSILLGLGRNAVDARLSRARRRLRQWLDEGVCDAD